MLLERRSTGWSHSAALRWISVIDDYLFHMVNADRKICIFFFLSVLRIICHFRAPEANKD